MDVQYYICHECDEISKISTPNRPGRYKCPNCGAKLYTYKPGMIDKLYAYNMAALLLFVLTNYFPFLSFEAAGNASHANFTTAILYLYREEQWLMGTAILLTTVLFPMIRIFTNIVLFGSLFHNYLPVYATQMIKVINTLSPWGMLDVFFLGILVSIVKLVKMGTIIPGISLWAYMTMVLILAAAQAAYDPHEVWEQIGARKRIQRQKAAV